MLQLIVYHSRQLEALELPQRPYSHARTVSSFYSEPSPDFDQQFPRDSMRSPSPVYTDNRMSVRPPSSVYTDISPPDSPGRPDTAEGRPGSPNISPTHEEHRVAKDIPRQDAKFRSNLPVLRKQVEGRELQPNNSGVSPFWKRKELDAVDRSSSVTRWDDFSGEPTNSETGKEAQVKPGSASLPHVPERGERQKDLLSAFRERDPSKRKVLEKKNKPVKDDPATQIPTREPWKGASGRFTIVNPPRNDPAARTQPLQPLQPISTSPKTNKRPIADKQQSRGQSTQTTPTVRAVAPETPETPDVSTTLDEDETIKPIVPLKVGRRSPPSLVTSPVSQHSQRDYTPSPLSESVKSPGVWSVRSEHNRPLPDEKETPSQLPRSQQAVRSEAEFLKEIEAIKPEEQPSSRFSATTYATTTYDSPPSSPTVSFDTPVPSVPFMPSPIVMRRRPMANPSPLSAPDVKATVRKPTPSQISLSSSYSNSSSKALPQCPPEMEAVDRVAALQARLDDLRRRRGNIHIIIRELTQVVQPSSVAYDMAAREEVKRTVASLNNELAEIGKEEHETGLKLHRAWKKRDKENIYESNALWIKRVTS